MVLHSCTVCGQQELPFIYLLAISVLFNAMDKKPQMYYIIPSSFMKTAILLLLMMTMTINRTLP
jgi:hypothetical protein